MTGHFPIINMTCQVRAHGVEDRNYKTRHCTYKCFTAHTKCFAAHTKYFTGHFFFFRWTRAFISFYLQEEDIIFFLTVLFAYILYWPPKYSILTVLSEPLSLTSRKKILTMLNASIACHWPLNHSFLTVLTASIACHWPQDYSFLTVLSTVNRECHLLLVN